MEILYSMKVLGFLLYISRARESRLPPPGTRLAAAAPARRGTAPRGTSHTSQLQAA